MLPNTADNFCFKIKTILGNASNYVICLDNQNNMLQLITIIKQLVINLQRKNGQILLNKKDKAPDSSDLLNKKSEKEKKESEALVGQGSTMNSGRSSVTVTNTLDGYWIKLQDWSSCSLKCGGGTQAYHRMCVPNKPGGKPCVGEAVLVRKCNEGPCPGIKKNGEVDKSKEKVGKPIIQVMPFSSRYQRYTVSYLNLFY